MSKTILVYATRWGATKETAQEIKNVLTKNLKRTKKTEILILMFMKTSFLESVWLNFDGQKKVKNFSKETKKFYQGKNYLYLCHLVGLGTPIKPMTMKNMRNFKRSGLTIL
jgi:flavodoxin